jgi:hypothetical protein
MKNVSKDYDTLGLESGDDFKPDDADWKQS